MAENLLGNEALAELSTESGCFTAEDDELICLAEARLHQEVLVIVGASSSHGLEPQALEPRTNERRRELVLGRLGETPLHLVGREVEEVGPELILANGLVSRSFTLGEGSR